MPSTEGLKAKLLVKLGQHQAKSAVQRAEKPMAIQRLPTDPHHGG
jgi:hypothetical protein